MPLDQTIKFLVFLNQKYAKEFKDIYPLVKPINGKNNTLSSNLVEFSKKPTKLIDRNLLYFEKRNRKNNGNLQVAKSKGIGFLLLCVMITNLNIFSMVI